MNRIIRQSGFTLVEMCIVIVMIGIIAAVATQKMSRTIESAQYEQTKQELDQLAYAIAGNPAVYANGTRTDYGYIGDVGAPPDDLEDLVTNPGGYDSWDGPYMGTGLNDDDYKKDAWGKDYSFSGRTITSSGGPSYITKIIASDTLHLVSNTVNGFVVDANHDVPGSNDTTSLTITLQYPNGSGSMTSSTMYPRPNGNFTFSGIPIGAHTLSVVYEPQDDTATYNVSVDPNSTVRLSITFPADLW